MIISPQLNSTKAQFGLPAVFVATAGVATILAVYRLLGLDLTGIGYCFSFLILFVAVVFSCAAIIAVPRRMPERCFVVACVTVVTLATCDSMAAFGAWRNSETEWFVTAIAICAALVGAAQAFRRPRSLEEQHAGPGFQFEAYRRGLLRYLVFVLIGGLLLWALGILAATFWLPSCGVQSDLWTVASDHQVFDRSSVYWPWELFGLAGNHARVWPVWLLLLLASAEAMQARRVGPSKGHSQMCLDRMATAHALAILAMTIDTLFGLILCLRFGNDVENALVSLSLDVLLWLPTVTIIAVTVGLLGPHRRELFRLAGWLYALSALGVVNVAMTAWLTLYLLTVTWPTA